MYPVSSVTDLSTVNAALKGMELQVKAIKERLHEEAEAIPKAKKLIAKSLQQQQKKLWSMSAYVPSYLPERTTTLNLDSDRSVVPEAFKQQQLQQPNQGTMVGELATLPKEKKSRVSPPLWNMRGRLTLEKVNAAVSDMVTYAEANAQLVAAPKKKLAENLCKRALELRDIAMTNSIKGKHFFLETDMKGPLLKLDILTILEKPF